LNPDVPHGTAQTSGDVNRSIDTTTPSLVRNPSNCRHQDVSQTIQNRAQHNTTPGDHITTQPIDNPIIHQITQGLRSIMELARDERGHEAADVAEAILRIIERARPKRAMTDDEANQPPPVEDVF